LRCIEQASTTLACFHEAPPILPPVTPEGFD
jgi:hypothetical protein